jgi:SOS-response transcriptional repressor LexA/DNA-binding XRE family transcriptional regulator
MGRQIHHHIGDLQAPFITKSVNDSAEVVMRYWAMTEKTKFPNHLRLYRDRAGLSQPQLAQLAGTSVQNVSRLERGDRQLTKAWAEKLAPHLGVGPQLLMFHEPGDDVGAFVDALASHLGPPIAVGGRPTYAGIVRAGQFLLVDEFNQDPEPVPEFVTYHPAFPKVRQYAWRASGDSMDKAGILDGMWIVGADAADYIDRHGEIESGELVVVERTRNQGAEREITVKEVRFYRDRYELLPRSSNPEHQPIVVPHDHGEADSEVKIIGLVLAAFTDLRRRLR